MLCSAWTEYKFTCVCVSVALCQLAYSFAVDSLKDAYLRKDVPFAGLDDE